MATLTIRLDERRQRALEEAARREGRSVSDVVRDALDRALGQHALSDRAGHVRGQLRLSGTRRTTWKNDLRARNWRS
jgi:uncharacterized protein (DUF1778 family)